MQTYRRQNLTAQNIERFVSMKISFDLGKNGRHRFRDLGSKLNAVVRQAHKTLAVYELYKIWQLQFWNMLRLLNVFILLITL